jgi:hypothetical protein
MYRMSKKQYEELWDEDPDWDWELQEADDILEDYEMDIRLSNDPSYPRFVTNEMRGR